MSLFEELKRRNVFRVGIAYAVSAWVLLQIVDLVLENVAAPQWVMQIFMLALAIGFPIALIFAWAFENHVGKADESQPFLTMDNLQFLAILGSAYVFEHQSDAECVMVDGSIWSESFRAQRKTPEFFEFMERASIVEYWREFGWPDDCASLDQTLAECN